MGLFPLKYVLQRNWEVRAMANEIMEELWRIKEEIGEEAGDDMKAFCRRLREDALARGAKLVSAPGRELKVAEDSGAYNARRGEMHE